MAQFDPTCIKIFQAGDWSGTAPNQVWTPDTTATYAMIDAGLLAEALVGLNPGQTAIINSYIYVPPATDFTNRGFSQWAGNDPPAVYFKITGPASSHTAKLQAALAKRYK